MILTVAEVRAYAAQAGFVGTGLDTIVQISGAETGGTYDTATTNTAGNTPPSTDRGIVQINSYWHAEVPDSCAFDPLCAMQAAYRISMNGTNFSEWATYGSGAYKSYPTGATGMTAPNPNVGVWAMSEFGSFNGDCVWSAVLSAAHRLNQMGWPLTFQLLDFLTRAAIAAGIGVGSEGQADPGQLEHMLVAWGIKYLTAYQYNGSPIPRATLGNILDSWLTPGPGNNNYGCPVILGFTNGQALTGDEINLHGHEIAVVFQYDPVHGGYPCSDGDNPICAQGKLVYYSLDVLEAAQPDSAYVLQSVPAEAPNMAVAINISTPGVSTYFSANADGSWHCKPTNVDLGTGMLQTYKTMPSLGSLAGLTELGLPTSDILYQPEGGCAIQVFERGVLVWDPQRKLDSPPGIVGDYYLAHKDFRQAAPPAPTPPPPPIEHVTQNGVPVVNVTVGDSSVYVSASIPIKLG